jgi:hypothetical protein
VTHARPASGGAARGIRLMSSTSAQRIRLKLVAAAGALVATSLIWSGGTFSTFDKTSTMPSNSVAAGTVRLADNDGGSSVLTLSAARPGNSVTACVAVSYSGTVAAQVRVYGTVAGTGLASYLNLTVTRGTISGSPAAGSCAGFVADSTAWISNGAGVMYNGLLSAFPVSTGTALADPNSTATETWSNGVQHVYKLALTLPGGVGPAAQGLTASAAFTWQAIST